MDAFAVWSLMMAAESVHGGLRSVLLEPRVGSFHSRQIGAIAGSLIVLGIAWLLIDWISAKDTRTLSPAGTMWSALSLSFEFGSGRLGLGYSWERILEDYDVSKGGLLLFGVFFMSISPIAASLLRRRRRRQ